MRTKLVLFILLTVLAGCAHDERIPDIADWIEFSSNPVYMLAGDEVRVEISYPSTFELRIIEKDPDFVTVGWYNEGKTLMIRTRGVGNTILYVVENRFGQQLELKVISEYFYGNYREGAVTHFFAYASNREVEEEIIADLTFLIGEREGTQYYFDQLTGEVRIDYSESKRGGGKITGTYQWDIESLIIQANGTTEKYLFYAEYYGDKTLCLNLTEYYRKKYPDESRISVEVMIHLEKIE